MGIDTATSSAVRAALAPHVDRLAVPGVAALVERGNDVHVETIGTLAFDDDRPVAADTIFRIASLSKPIGAAAAMRMVESGTFALDDPVEEWLPELADRQVLRSADAQLDDTVPAKRPILVRDLLDLRLGLGVAAQLPFTGTTPIQLAEQALDLKTMGPPWPPTGCDNDEWMARIGTLPLLHQPGEGWTYNTGIQVLGVLLERAGGAPLEDVLRARLLDPLGMRDTAFSVPPDKLERLAAKYAPAPGPDAESATWGNGLVLSDDPGDSYWSRPPRMPNLSGWLVSTLDDFAAFARMLRNRGMHGGRRLLDAESIAQMTSPQLTAGQRDTNTMFLGPGGSWGLGMRVPDPTAPNDPDGSPVQACWGWDGGSGCSWRHDPARDLTMLLLTQRAMVSPMAPRIFEDFWNAAIAA